MIAEREQEREHRRRGRPARRTTGPPPTPRTRAGRDRAPDFLLERQEHAGREHEHEHPQRVERRVVGLAQSAEREDLEAVGGDARRSRGRRRPRTCLPAPSGARDRRPTRARRRPPRRHCSAMRRAQARAARRGLGASTPFPLVRSRRPTAVGRGWPHPCMPVRLAVSAARRSRPAMTRQAPPVPSSVRPSRATRGATHGEGSAAPPSAAAIHRRTVRRAPRKGLVAGITVIAVVALAACGSGTSTAKSPSSTTPASGATAPVVKTLGDGVTADAIKVGITLVDFKCHHRTDRLDPARPAGDLRARSSTTSTTTAASRAARSFPSTRRTSPLGSTQQILTVCTSLTEDEQRVRRRSAPSIDSSGDAQTCIAKQHKRVLLTFDLDAGDHRTSRRPASSSRPAAAPNASWTSCSSSWAGSARSTGKTVAVLGDHDARRPS